jgi:hypothetical protein
MLMVGLKRRRSWRGTPRLFAWRRSALSVVLRLSNAAARA